MISEIVKSSLKKAMDYPTYLSLTEKLVAENRTTGEDQSPMMVQFTKLNLKRMQRLDKTLKINDESQSFFEKYNKKQTWIVITESWCGDASQIVPVFYKIVQLNPNFDLKLVLRDENESLMNQFLTNGGKAIPMLIIVDAETLEVQHIWGPRPALATAIATDCKAKFGKFTDECKEELQKWYNKDKGQSIVSELVNLLKK